MSTVAPSAHFGRPEMRLRAAAPAQHAAAKAAGFLYVFTMAASMFAFYIRGQLIVSGDAVQTARNIAASERLFRFSVASDLVMIVLVVLLVWALYVVLEPISKNLALLAAFWRIVENSILAVATLNAFVALRLLSGADYLRAVEIGQLQALARVFLTVYGAGFNVGFVFLGLGSTVFSYLWLKSRYIPRALASWGIFSSLLLAIGTLAVMVFPGLGVAGLAYMIPMGIYEVGLGFCLIFRGIRAPVVK